MDIPSMRGLPPHVVKELAEISTRLAKLYDDNELTGEIEAEFDVQEGGTYKLAIVKVGETSDLGPTLYNVRDVIVKIENEVMSVERIKDLPSFDEGNHL